MKRTFLLSALMAVTLIACGKKEEAAPAAAPAPQAEAAQPANPAQATAAPAEQKTEEQK